MDVPTRAIFQSFVIFKKGTIVLLQWGNSMPALCRHNNLDTLHGDGRGQDVAALGGSGAEESALRPQRAHKVFWNLFRTLTFASQSAATRRPAVDLPRPPRSRRPRPQVSFSLSSKPPTYFHYVMTSRKSVFFYVRPANQLPLQYK